MNFLGLTCCLGVLRPKKKIFFQSCSEIGLPNDMWHSAKNQLFWSFLPCKTWHLWHASQYRKVHWKTWKNTSNMSWSKVQDSFVNELFEYQLYLGNMLRSLFWPSGVCHKNHHFLTGHFSPERPVHEGTSEVLFVTRYRERAREARTRTPRGKRIADRLPSVWGPYKKNHL